eukprot:158303-Amphidinium_carterae.1
MGKQVPTFSSSICVDGRQIVKCEKKSDLTKWLRKHHAVASSVWLERWRQGNEKHIPQSDIVKELLCFGWIDSTVRKLDERRSMIMISPRRVGSSWSKLNKTYVAELEAKGLLQKSGAEKIARAKADGSWTFLNDVDKLLQPCDLKDGLRRKGSKAVLGWDKIPPSLRRGLLEKLKRSKGEDTRKKYIEQIVQEALRRNS